MGRFGGGSRLGGMGGGRSGGMRSGSSLGRGAGRRPNISFGSGGSVNRNSFRRGPSLRTGNLSGGGRGSILPWLLLYAAVKNKSNKKTEKRQEYRTDRAKYVGNTKSRPEQPRRPEQNPSGEKQQLWLYLTLAFTLIVMVALLGASCGRKASSGAEEITHSTIKREALPKGSVNETGYYENRLDWSINKTKLQKGMEAFYEKTGVQPYLYLADSLALTENGETQVIPEPEEADFAAFAEAYYDSHFTDEAHLLIVFCYSGRPKVPYRMYWYAGSLASRVIDDEAADILMDALMLNYENEESYPDGSEDKMFSDAFAEAGKRIMRVDRSPWLYVLILAVAAILAIVGFDFWKARKAQKNKEAEQMKDILNTPLSSFADQSVEELAKKYETK